MKGLILKNLRALEIEHGVKILYACESGSRAWGFASLDSDYDVRFFYLQRPEWYLSINRERERDVIELPIEGDLDINGWDLRKALQLFQKSNPPLLEWLGSPIVYMEPYTIADKMRALTPSCYSPLACMHHYFKMAKENYRDYLQGEEVSLKKYLYVIRPILAVIWIERETGVMPTEFHKLIEGVVDDEAVKGAIMELLRVKIRGTELERGPKIPAISNFLDDQIMRTRSR